MNGGCVRRVVGIWIALALVPTACSGGGSNADPGIAGSITVAAAASLSVAFRKIGADFEHKHPRASVRFDFDASSALVTRIQSGAPADVFASADTANMDKLVNAGLVAGTPGVFARNRLEIATKPGNPKRVSTLADLATVGIVSLCASEVPCGKYAAEVLGRAGVAIPSGRITRGPNATVTLGAVSQGDADAAVVYVTDVEAARRTVAGVPIPDAENAIAAYPIGVLDATRRHATASAFAAYVASPAGGRTLRSFGFLAP